jgi:hypothetical protein
MSAKNMKTGTAKIKESPKPSAREKAVDELADVIQRGLEHLPEEEQDRRIAKALKRLNNAS